MGRDIEFRSAGYNRGDRHIIYAQSAVKAVRQFIDTATGPCGFAIIWVQSEEMAAP